VVLAAAAGGLRQLLAGRDEDVQGLVQRAMVTISHHEQRPGEAQGNKPGWMMVPKGIAHLRKVDFPVERAGRASRSSQPRKTAKAEPRQPHS